MAKNNINAVSDSDTKTGAEAPENVTVSKPPHSSEKEKTPEKVKAEAAPAKNTAFAYLGPTIRGVITNGAILIGQKDDIVSAIKARAEIAGYGSKMGDIARLVVPDVGIAKAKAQLLEGGNSLGMAFNRILAET